MEYKKHEKLRRSVSHSKNRLTVKYIKNLNLVMVKCRSNVLEVKPVYFKLIESVKSHLKFSNRLTCYFDYSIVNATTIKLLFNLFNVLKYAHQMKKKVTVYWIVDQGDEDVIDAGYDFWGFYDFRFVMSFR